MPIGSLRQAFVELEPEYQRNISVTENGGGKHNILWFFGRHFDPLSDTVTVNTSGTAPSPPEPSSPEGGDQAQSAQPSTQPPDPHAEPLVRRNPFKKVLDRIRSLVRRVFHHRHH